MSTQLLNIINKLSTGSVSESAIAQILTVLETDKITINKQETDLKRDVKRMLDKKYCWVN